MTEQLDELVKQWKDIQEKIQGYEKLSKQKKTNTYARKLGKLVDELTDIEMEIKKENQKLERNIKTTVKKLEAKNKTVKSEKKTKEELKDIYCGAQKPRKNKKMGTEEQCRIKGQIRLYGHKKVSGKTGGKLAAGIIAKFIKASHDKEYHDVGDFKIDRGLSHEWVKVYHNPKNNQAVVVHRGTADTADWWTDAKLLFQQKNNNRFKTSEKVQKAAEKKYGAENVTTIGSSLGGYLAEEFGQNSKEIITVSKPTTPLDVLKRKMKGEKQHDIRTTLDPIAILQNFQKGEKDIVIPSKTLNPFDNHMGDKVSGRLPEDQMVGEGMLKKMKVKELRQLVKDLRRQKRGRARKYPVTKTKKCDLCKMIIELQNN